MSFATTRARDAWGPIRGYVYQVDTTIRRWIELPSDTWLELECGEDIDHVVSAFEAEDDRLLEQIKVRESGLSLRSAEALTAIANAIEHEISNPGQKLRFRFTTTARVAREQDHPDRDAAPGIILWERVRTDASGVTLRLLGEILQRAHRPPSVSATLWDLATTAFADEARLLDLVQRFEWATSETSPEQLPNAVVEALLTNGHAKSRDDAQALYEELFAFLFHLLGQRGSKRLTAELLFSRAAPDRVTSERVRARLDALNFRTSILVKRVDALDAHLATSFGLPNAAIGLGVVDLDVSPPPTTATLAARTRLVSEIAGASVPWVAIDGAAGVGKSHLALLVLRALSRTPVWIRLGMLTPDEAATRMVRVLATWSKVASLDTSVVLEAARESAGETTTFCFDDVPPVPKDHVLGTLLVKLSKLFDRPVSVVTTSSQLMPQQVSAAASCRAQTCAPFSTDEAVELFSLFGGSEFVATQANVVERLVAFTQGHPTLLGSLASFLREREWIWDAATFEGIWRGSYTAGTHVGTRAALVESVPDSSVRDLLYRLKVHFGSFTTDIVRAVARVDPSLNRPVELLATVTGTWAQRTSEARWRLSPLLTALPNDDLAADVRRACNSAIAEELLRGPLNGSTASSVVTHLMLAEEYDKAGFVLASVLTSMAEHEKRADSDAMLLWSSTSLPDKMTTGTRIRVRHAQVLVGARYGKDTTFAARDLEMLLARATDADAWAVVVVEIARFRERFRTQPESAPATFKRLHDWAARATNPKGEKINLPDLALLVWHVSSALDSRSHVDAWLEMLESLTPSERAVTAVVRGVCRGACDELWLRESRRPSADARWAEVLDELRAMIESARRMDFLYLEACATSTMITVLCEETNAFVEGTTVGESFLAAHSDDEDCVLLATEALGRQHLFAGHGAQSLTYLRRALTLTPRLEPTYACITANYASRAAALMGDAREARSLAERTVEIAAAVPNLRAAEWVRALGERAIAEWHDGDSKGAARTLLLAADRFEDFESQALRDVRRPFTQVAVALGNHADPSTAIRVSMLPPRGFFYGARWREGGIEWREDLPTWLAFRFCRLAESVGDDRRARKWAARSLEYGPAGAEHGISLVMQTAMMPYVLLSERDDAAVALATHVAAIAVEARVHPPAHAPQEAMFEQANGPLVLWGMLPLAFALATSAIDNREVATAVAMSAAQILRGLESESPVSRTWREAAALIEAPYQRASFRDLVAKGNSAFASDADEGLRLLAYFQASIAHDVPLELAVRLHLEVASTLWMGAAGSQPIRRTVERFVDRNWTSTFKHQQFRFRTPRQLAPSVDALASRPLAERARPLLKLMAGGLGVTPTPRARAWLDARA